MIDIQKQIDQLEARGNESELLRVFGVRPGDAGHNGGLRSNYANSH